MKRSELLQAWGRVLTGRRPAMSIEITKECPLRCPGCYAYEDQHLGGAVTLRQLVDRKGSELVEGVLALGDRHRPLHLSLVGGDPLVRFRELDLLLPQLNQRGIFVQVVTSAFRPLPLTWARLSRLNLCVSIDGLQPEHDERRQPATYDRILKNIAGHRVIVHCTLTGQMMKRPGYLEEFVQFWSARPEVRKIWMSMFTPQRGEELPECLTPAERQQVIEELLRVRRSYPKLRMDARTIREFARPPASPADCLFAQTTETLSADLKTRITPCQFGGDPDCSQCGCMASMALQAVAHRTLVPGITVGTVARASLSVGRAVSRLRSRDSASPFRILTDSPGAS